MPNNYRFKELRKRTETDDKNPLTAQQLSQAFKNIGYYIDRNRITALENKSNVIPNIEDLKAYCELFNTTSDYLLGLRDTKPVDENIAMICKTTGLSDDSIATLKKVKNNWDKKEKNTLNYIMKDSDLFLDFLEWLSIYIDNDYTVPLAYDKEKGQIPCNNVLGNVVLGKEIKDNKGNDGYKTIGIGVDILESHAMLKMQEIIGKWKNSK